MQNIIDTEIKAFQAKDIKVCVFDLDLTLIKAHTKGAIVETDLDYFIKSISPVAIQLILSLLKADFKVAIATMTDELYNDLLIQRDINNKKTPNQYLSGRQLVIKLLETFLTKDEIKKIPIITINPDLYPPNDNKKCDFFVNKLTSLGFKQGSCNPESLKKIMVYPPLKNKDHHLAMIKEIFKCQYDNMLLIDDKIENILGGCKLGCYGIHVETINGQHGIMQQHLDPKKILMKRNH